MAALIEQARAARAEAERLRMASRAVRVDARRQTDVSKARVARTCATYVRVHELRIRPLPGVWSDLHWLPPDELLDVVLVPVAEGAAQP